jgi:hypothetical protein
MPRNKSVLAPRTTNVENDPPSKRALNRPLEIIAAALPISKLSAAQTVNAIGDLCAAVLGLCFLWVAENDGLKFALVVILAILAFMCFIVTHQRRPLNRSRISRQLSDSLPGVESTKETTV